MLVEYHGLLSHLSHLCRHPQIFASIYGLALKLHLSVILAMSSHMHSFRGS
jgi:hypothetical protein